MNQEIELLPGQSTVLFYNPRAFEQRILLLVLKERLSDLHVFDINEFNINPSNPMHTPTLYAPIVGELKGRQIDWFLNSSIAPESKK